MLVKMKSTYCTAAAYCDPGKCIDVPADEAKQLIDGNFAEAVKPEEVRAKKAKIGTEPRGDDLEEDIKGSK